MKTIVSIMALLMTAVVTQEGVARAHLSEISAIQSQTELGDDFTYKIEPGTAGTIVVHFLPQQKASKVSISFKINSGTKTKVKMTRDTQGWSASIGSLTDQDTVEFYFSYTINKKRHTSRKFQYVYSISTPTPT